MALPGFDPEFADLPDYIHKITERIWEGRGIGLIRDWYAADCVVHTTMGPSIGAETAVRATIDTLRVIPDRRLLAEDVIWSEDAPATYLSSHRLIAPGHHRGDSALGPATGRTVTVRAIADCLCRDNQVVEEWLVRDAAGLVLQIGGDPAEVAARLAADGQPAWQIEPAAMLKRDKQFRPAILPDHPAATIVRHTMHSMWQGELDVVAQHYHPACSQHVPGFVTRYGHDGVWSTMFGYLSAFPDAEMIIEHQAVLDDPGHATRVATRWWLTGTHTGFGPFGPPSGTTVLILGINHAHVVGGRIREEWMLVDDLAVHVQIARKRG